MRRGRLLIGPLFRVLRPVLIRVGVREHRLSIEDKQTPATETSTLGRQHTPIGSAPRDHSTYGVFSHVPSPGVPGGPQRPKIGQTQILSRRELSLLSCPTLELIEFGSRNAATKNNAPETSSKKYLAQPSINLTLTLDRLISDVAIDQTIIGSTAPKTNISREYLTAWVICIATSGT